MNTCSTCIHFGTLKGYTGIELGHVCLAPITTEPPKDGVTRAKNPFVYEVSADGCCELHTPNIPNDGGQAPSGRVHPLVRRLRRLQAKAAKNAIPWSAKKPTKRGVWYGAKWQFAGYYHIGCYPNETVKYLRNQNNEYWSGPYKSREKWMSYMPPPNAEVSHGDSEKRS